MKGNLYISSMAFGNSIEQIISRSEGINIQLEFSSGIMHHKHALSIFNNFKGKKLMHNYFPAPKTPFVLNLASKNEKIRFSSINHCLINLEISKQNNIPFFSAHSGFCIDPGYESLGHKLVSYSNKIEKKEHFKLFEDSLLKIKAHCEKNDICFLIENNVITKENILNGSNPLLCCSSNEIIEFLKSINSKHINLLLDTAHLKVSCNSLKLNLMDEMKSLIPFTKAIHHSDNNGIYDTNDKLNETYWFKTFLPYFKEIPHVLEIKAQNDEEILHQLKTFNKWF